MQTVALADVASLPIASVTAEGEHSGQAVAVPLPTLVDTSDRPGTLELQLLLSHLLAGGRNILLGPFILAPGVVPSAAAPAMAAAAAPGPFLRIR